MNLKKTTVSVEDLLRVKRAERPPAEFWNEFDRELRLKQLAAIVEPRPWWAPFIRIGTRVSHYQVPLGAAAILALSLVTVSEYRTAGIQSGSGAEVSAPIASVQLPATPVATALAMPRPAEVQLAAIEVVPSENSSSEPLMTGRVSHSTPLLDAAPVIDEPSPSARYIAANLAAVRADNPSIIEEAFGVMISRTEVREPMRDPLSQISSPGESRRSRLLATSLPAMAGSGDVAFGTSQRVARHLTEERLYDSISRVGVKGDRVAIKF